MLKARKQDKSLKIRTKFDSACLLINYCYSILDKEEMLRRVYKGKEEELQYGKILEIPLSRLLICYLVWYKMRRQSSYYKRKVIKQIKENKYVYSTGSASIVKFPIGKRIKSGSDKREIYYILVSKEMGNLLMKMMRKC